MRLTPGSPQAPGRRGSAAGRGQVPRRGAPGVQGSPPPTPVPGAADGRFAQGGTRVGEGTGERTEGKCEINTIVDSPGWPALPWGPRSTRPDRAAFWENRKSIFAEDCRGSECES